MVLSLLYISLFFERGSSPFGRLGTCSRCSSPFPSAFPPSGFEVRLAGGDGEADDDGEIETRRIPVSLNLTGKIEPAPPEALARSFSLLGALAEDAAALAPLEALAAGAALKGTVAGGDDDTPDRAGSAPLEALSLGTGLVGGGGISGIFFAIGFGLG